MKKTVLIATVLFIFYSAGAAGHGFPWVPEKFEKNFQKLFPGKTVSVWTEQGDFTVARFTENGEKYDAYFDNKALYLAVIKFTTLNKLPINIANAFKKKCKEIADISVLEIRYPDNSVSYLTQYIAGKKMVTLKAIPESETVHVEISNIGIF